jgi:hypothetical protein
MLEDMAAVRASPDVDVRYGSGMGARWSEI